MDALKELPSVRVVPCTKHQSTWGTNSTSI